jgi:hypothetical protein
MSSRNDRVFFNRELFVVAVLGLLIVAEESQLDSRLRKGSGAAENQKSNDA